MDFDDEHDDEMDEEEEEDIPVGFDSLPNSASQRPRMEPTAGEGSSSARKPGSTVRYRECLKNHAVTIGGHAVDGCGEFIAAGEEGTLDALKCAACNCHRNFHRKKTDAEQPQKPYSSHNFQHHHHPPQFSHFYRAPLPPPGYLQITTAPAQQRLLVLPAGSGGGTVSREEEDMSNPSSSGGGGGGGSGSGMKKRQRTKFSKEQKEKMVKFAEKLGWRIQKHDEEAVEEFCAENSVRRQVFKVWMHNNKHTLGNKP